MTTVCLRLWCLASEGTSDKSDESQWQEDKGNSRANDGLRVAVVPVTDADESLQFVAVVLESVVVAVCHEARVVAVTRHDALARVACRLLDLDALLVSGTGFPVGLQSRKSRLLTASVVASV